MKMPERVDATEFAEAMSEEVSEARTETRGRKKKTQASEDVRAMDLAVQKQHEQELSIAEVDKMFLEENETYNFHICMTRARDALNKIGDGMLEAGAQLASFESPHGKAWGVLRRSRSVRFRSASGSTHDVSRKKVFKYENVFAFEFFKNLCAKRSCR